MSYTLTIDGTEFNPLDRSLRGAKKLNGRDTLRFAIHLENQTQPIDVGDPGSLVVDASTIFGGTVDEIDDVDAEVFDEIRRRVSYVLEAYDQICERRIVAEVYESQTLGAIVADIVTNFLDGEGVTTNNVEAGPTITKVVFNYMTAAQAFNELSDLTGYHWYIDAGRDLHFAARSTNQAPFNITASNRPYRAFSVRRHRLTYRNRQLVRAGLDTTDSRTETFVGDGARQSFTLQFPVATVPTVELNSGAQTVGILGIDSGKDWYWNKESKEIVQELSDPAITSTDTLEITYQGLFPIIVRSQDDTQISDRATKEGLSGIYEAVSDDPNIDDSNAALEKAEGLLRRYGSIDKTVTYETREHGLQPGQLQRIEQADHDVAGEYLIDQVDFFVEEDSHEMIYRVTALSGESFGGWAEFFRRLAMAGRKYVIRENEVLVLLRTFEDDVAIEHPDVTVTEHTPGTDFVFGTATFGYSQFQ